MNNNAISFHFTNNKAGMDGLNREQMNKIIEEATKNSAIYQKQKADRKKIESQVYEWKNKLEGFKNNTALFNHIEKLKNEKMLESVMLTAS